MAYSVYYIEPSIRAVPIKAARRQTLLISSRRTLRLAAKAAASVA